MLSRQEELDIERERHPATLAERPAVAPPMTPLERLAFAERARTAMFEEIACQYGRGRESYGIKIEALGNGAGIKIITENNGDGSRILEVIAAHGPWLRDQLARIFPKTEIEF